MKILRKIGGEVCFRIYINGIFEDYLEYSSSMGVTGRSCEIAVGEVLRKRIGDSFGDAKPADQWALKDHLSSVSVLVDNYGALINSEEYYPFGETSFGSYAYKRYRYTGKERDTESGLYYYGARYYLAWVCRFIGVDPLWGKYLNQSGYCYANNNPMVFNDPTGMEGEEASGGGGGNATNITPVNNDSNNRSLDDDGRPKSGARIFLVPFKI